MEKEKGTLIRWNNDKGYGFIRSHKENKDIFLHVKSLPHYQRRPKIDDVITYEVDVDEKQQYYARSAKIKGLAWSQFTILFFSSTLLFGIYVYLVFSQRISFHPLSIYAAMSILTIWAYSRDKSASQIKAWRISERRLHLYEMLGGWPGALLAQLYYRHKSRKISYQVFFWLIVASHCIFWYFIINHMEMYQANQQLVTEKINLFINQTKEQTLYLYGKINSGDGFSIDGRAEMTDRIKAGYRSKISSNKQLKKLANKGQRSIIIPDKQLRIVEGVVKEIRPLEGIIVSLQSGTGAKGIIDKSTLTKNFSSRFMPEERIQVAIYKIKMEGNKQRIDLILVE